MERWPYLTSEVPGCGGGFKLAPEDFVVDELPAYAPCGEGEHLFFWVEKVGRDTPSVARAIARALGIPEREVSYAGLKDRQAITRQQMCVSARLEGALASLSEPGVRISGATRHRNKLRTGHLKGNRFRIRLRGVRDAGAAAAVLERLTREGLPNYFGEQRFGAHMDNAAQGKRLLLGQRLPRRPDRFERRLFLSAFQSLLFNRALAARLSAGTFGRAVAGDVMEKLETGGLFVCRSPADEQPRVDRFEVSPAGPMFGPRMFPAEGEVAAFEAGLLAREGLTPADFARGGGETQGGRRAFRLPFTPAPLEREGDDLWLSFELPRGSYATVVVRELLKDGGEAP